MYLEQAEVRNFRGIRHLKVDFEPESTALIGENSWGKTSLLRALWLILGQGKVLCRFARDDVYVPVPLLGDAAEEDGTAVPAGGSGHFRQLQSMRRQRQRRLKDLRPMQDFESLYLEEQAFQEQDVFLNVTDNIRILLVFRAAPGDEVLERAALRGFWQDPGDGGGRLCWQIRTCDELGEFVTRHELIDACGRPCAGSVSAALMEVLTLCPVLRLRDRRMSSAAAVPRAEHDDDSLLESMLQGTAPTGETVSRGLKVISTLADKYLAGYGGHWATPAGRTRNIADIVSRPVTLETMTTLREDVSRPGMSKHKLLLSFLAVLMRQSDAGHSLSPDARPIIILEDIESRLHPSLLLSLWSLVEYFDVQKIVTTNSGDLLSAMPVSALRRLHRQNYDTQCYRIAPGSISREDMRRIAFHLRLNRPMTLFARCWLLVEGETEIWILTQAAAILGISLQCDGIRPVEFAQCGLMPLIRFARQLGIGFYVLTDGDDAGQKYAATVRSQVTRENLDSYLSVLPAADIEHYLYASGYEDVYVRACGIPPARLPGTDKIIELAVKKKTKPTLALEVIEQMRRRGRAGVPKALAAMFGRLREQYVF